MSKAVTNRIKLAVLLALLFIALAGCAGETLAATQFTVGAPVLEYRFDLDEEEAQIAVQIAATAGDSDENNITDEDLDMDIRWYANAANTYSDGEQVYREAAILDSEIGTTEVALEIDTNVPGVTYYYAKAEYFVEGNACDKGGRLYYANSPLIVVVVGNIATDTGNDPPADSSAVDSSSSSGSVAESSTQSSSSAASSSQNPQPEYQFYITSQPGAGPFNYATGNNVAISVSAYSSATAAENLQYQWYTSVAATTEGATMLTGQTGQTLTIASQNPSNQFYFCVVTDPATAQIRQTGITNVAVLGEAVGQNWVRVVVSPATIPLDGGTFTASASGAGTISYQWYASSDGRYSNPELLVGQTGATLEVTTGLSPHAYYYCVATSTLNGSSVSAYSNEVQRSDSSDSSDSG